MDVTNYSRIIKPQEGFQKKFLSSPADIVIGGGAAGAGKTFAEVMEPLRHRTNKEFTAVIFRRNIPQITMQGGLRDETLKLYPTYGAKLSNQHLKWYFPSGATVKMTHLEDDSACLNHQGGQYALIIFDELTHFSRFQFFYMLTRNRSTCGVKPYIRATCNPDPDSWLAEFLEWWIDQNPKSPTFGFPIAERAGVLRYMVTYKEDVIWGDTKAEVYQKVPKEYWDLLPKEINPADMIKSVTFIPGSIFENKELLAVNPQYLGNLMAQSEQIKSQLLDGNWKLRSDATSLFHYQASVDLFTNYVPPSERRYITCDAARFGNDLTVIFVWKGWQVVKIVILTKSDANEIVAAIEEERKRFQVPISQILVDQDGVGGGVVSLGKYKGFSGGSKPLKDPKTRILENYENLKTQCYYRMANRVNNGCVSISVSNETVVVDGVFGKKMKLKGKLQDVQNLIIQDLRVIKPQPPDKYKNLRINPKDGENGQKVLLGRSPDFADTLMMREYQELKGEVVMSEEPEEETILSELDFD